ncbi:aspartyl/asparaginyl beta-hydroxylase domain-containing protein [Pontixanthobacter aquaemixtae]|uniref:Aspartyl/asparaginyl beta-hydroxylase domain-containing protein n=1 Tax=Pontixanthobacter aquaemixtae TaxID=1958940 RepID=A0A844ZTT6_9SPHN|nr:aspartyl/asparaginyl beta-hydroxylase domain-containing protein [Pontixanthobacter aquaemixtae]MXO91148.1 aspartyl/asparaginyl beta-hydroxylase domain-containing protein [Pontixanthobacter aquaemixtae]
MNDAPHTRETAQSPSPPDKAEGPPVYSKPKQTCAVRLGKKLRDPVNGFLAKQSLIGDTPILDPADVPGLNVVAGRWEEFRDEIQPLMRERENIPPLGEISPDHRRIASTPAWKSFFFAGYGYEAKANQARCPKLVEAINSIPGVVVAFLSIMEPGTHVPLHRGLTKSWLNCHLPLMIPDDGKRCEIAINGEIHQWRYGEWLVFDETFPHEVWNESDQPRVMLLLQVQRRMRWPGRLITRGIYHGVRNSSFVDDVKAAIGASKS